MMRVKKKKFHRTAEIIEKRIKLGDYNDATVPSERSLADEMMVSSFTVRKAYNHLVEKGLLERKENGRLIIKEKIADNTVKQMALFLPSFSSRHLVHWCYALEHVGASKNIKIRPMVYNHWDDSILTRNLDAFDGIFLAPMTDGVIPERIIKRLQQSSARIVALDADCSSLGIPSITMFNIKFIDSLLAYLYNLGHRRIDCVNIQPHNPILDKRIDRWELWRRENYCPGNFYDLQGQQNIHHLSNLLSFGRDLVLDVLSDRDPERTAIFCTTGPCAISTLRACYELGLVVGRDISVCAIDTEGLVRCACPSITALEGVEPDEVLTRCIDWMLDEKSDWAGELRIEPESPTMFMGESTHAIDR